ncbi:MAG: glycosyltransferase [Kouleothrix sp.]
MQPSRNGGRRAMPALDRAQATPRRPRYGLRGPFAYVGGLDARKNLPLLLRAWAALRRAGGPPGTLVIAGRALGGDARLFPDIDALIGELGIGSSVARVDVPHADNHSAVQCCRVFAFPSRYEGFELAAARGAMACGTPVVASVASSLPEVLGMALLAGPDDLPAWVAALWRLLADAELRAELRTRGLARAAASATIAWRTRHSRYTRARRAGGLQPANRVRRDRRLSTW